MPTAITKRMFCCLIIFLLLASRPSFGVSIRKKKHLSGSQLNTDQTVTPRQPSAELIDEHQPAVAASEPLSIKTTSAETSSKRKSLDINRKPRKKTSTEAVRKFYQRKREAREKGDPKAIEFFKKESSRKASREMRKREKVFSGEATQAEEEKYKEILARNRRYKHNNREKVNEYKRKWRADQRAKKSKD